MYTINIDEIEEGSTENIEIWVAGQRRITMSLTKHGHAIQSPWNVGLTKDTEGSFYATFGKLHV